MSVSDEAVEAAAQAMRDKYAAEVVELPVSSFMDDARVALEAAAPHMLDKAAETRLMAMVWTDAYGAGFQEGAGFGPTPNPFRSQP